jgi:WD40 repeat protein
MRIVSGEAVGGHGGAIEPPAFSPDGARLVSGDREGWLMVRERRGEGAGARFETTARIRVPAAGPYSRPQVRAVAWPPGGDLVATHEYDGLHVRRAADLSEVRALPNVGKGPISVGGGGTWLAALSGESVHVLGFPGLERRGFHVLSRGGFEYFHLGELATDPAGAWLAVSDDGGRDETAMAMVLRSGEPQVTLLDAERGAVVGAIESGTYVNRLAWDPWRLHWIAATHGDVGVWSAAGEPVRRFRPYEKTRADTIAVAERWIATAARHAYNDATVDLWEPATFAHLASVRLANGIPPGWIVASPDGRTFLTPEIPVGRDFAIGVWSVED